MDQRIGRVSTPFLVCKAPVLARQVYLAHRPLRRLGAKAVLAQHVLPQLHTFIPQGLLLLSLSNRHLPVPVRRQRHPPGGIEIWNQRLRVADLLRLVFGP